MTEFIFVRHGQSKANAEKLIADDNSPLTEFGKEQSVLAAQIFKGLGITVVASSPLLRAQQTAEIISGELGVDLSHIAVIDELKERDLGPYKGKPKTQSSEYYITIEGDGVETREATLNRMYVCIDKLRALSKQGKVLAVGHAFAGYYLLEAAKSKSYTELEPPSEVSNAYYITISV